MKMKCKRLTASVLVAVLLLALLPTVSPRAASGVSDWVLASEAPSWAQITDRKYTYDLTTTTESKETSLAGYTQTGSQWVKSGNGAAHYASFPSGYDTTHSYYTGWRKSAFTASETQTAKREVSNTFAGYVYWHWMYDCGGAAASSAWRNIYYQKGTRGYGYKYFGAFVSTTNYSKAPGGTYSTADANAGYQWYEVPLSDRSSYAATQGTRFWYRFNYYTSSYTDYYKMFCYSKVEKLESATMPTGSGVSNVQEWVRYLLLTNVRFDVNYDSVPVNRMRAPTVESGWNKEADGTLSYSHSGVSVVYDSADESFTFHTGGQSIEGTSLELYRFPLDETLPVGSYVNLSVRCLEGTQSLDNACLVLEGAPLNSKALSQDRCTMGVYPPADGGWYTISTGPLTAYQSQNIQSILIWLWTSEGSASFDQMKLQFSVSFTGQSLSADGICSTPMERSAYCAQAYGTLPQPRRTGYSFAGWYTQRNGGSLVTADTVMTQNTPHSLYAAWTANSYTLLLDAQGGTGTDAVSVTYHKPIGELPVPERQGYKFLGWYTEPKGGTLVEATEIVDFTGERTVYACWIPNELLPCGEGLSWELRGNRLVISGTGALMDYAEGASPFSLLSGYIRELVVDNGVSAIGSNAFADLSNVSVLVLPETVEQLGQGALDGCTALSSLRVESPLCQLCELPENLSQIIGYSGSTAETYATEHGIPFRSLGFYQQAAGFSYRYQEENATLYIHGSGALPDYAVGEAPWYAKRLTLKAVQITGEISYIGNNSFAGCEQLTGITLPKTVKSFGENVFEDTPWYTSKAQGVVILNGVVYGFRPGSGDSNLVLSGGTTKIESNFSLFAREGETGLRSLQISSSVSQIEDGALSWFSQLSELTVQKGNGAYQTVDSVLYSKDMKQLISYPGGLKGSYHLPASVVRIRPYAFAGCKDLTEIHLGQQVQSIGADAFSGSGLQTIYGYYDSYARQYAEENGYPFVPYTTTVTLDSNNDSRQLTTIEVYTGSAIGPLPTPAQAGYRFLGWFLETEQEDLLITADYVVREDMTLLAFWEELPEEGPYLQSLSILSEPNKLSYYCGESVLTEGLRLQAHYSDGTVQTVTEGMVCMPSRLNTPGTQLVTVYYGGLSASFTVQVTQVVPVSLTLISLPKVLTYYVTAEEEGTGALQTRGLTALVEYNNGTQQLITNSGEFEYVYDLSKASESSTVNVNYRMGDVVVAAFYQIRVLEKPTLYSEDLSAKTGEEITVPIYISGNTGLMGLGVELHYDASVLEPETLSGNMSGTIGWNKGYAEPGSLKLLWSHSEEYSDDGLLFSVNFRVLPHGAAGDSEVTVSYLEEDSFNGSYEGVQFHCSSAVIRVERVEKPTFYSDALTAEAGQYLDVPVYIKNNVGVEEFSVFTMSYDKQFFDYVQSVGSSDAVFRITQQDGKLKILLNEISAAREDGLLMTLRFKVSTEAEGSYGFAFTIDDDRWECQAAQAEITAVVLHPTISAESRTAAPGVEISIPVMLTENPGLMGYHLRLPYDPSALRITDVIVGAGWGGSFDYVAQNGILEVLWTNSENVTENGLLFTVKLSTLTAGVYELQWDCVEENTYNEAWQTLTLQCEPISLRVAQPVEDSSLKLNHSLNLASDISVNLLVPKSLLAGFDMTTVYVESTLETYEGNEKTGTLTLRIDPVENGNYYYFTLNGLTAIQMNDKIFSVLYGTKDGQAYYSPVDEYSIASYAYSQMNHAARPEALKVLCANLLRYGAKAQIFKAYRTDALADANMTQAHRAYLSDMDAVTFGNHNTVLDDLDNAPITWAGKSLNLESKVALKLVFDPAGYTGDVSKLTLRVSFEDINAMPKTLTLEAPELYNPTRKLYAFTLDALLAAELRAVISVQIFDGDTAVSPTLQYSADTYGNNKTGALLELCKALFAYSDSAKAYFTS